MTQNVSAVQRLRRFLYTSNESPRYITGNPEKHNYYEPEKLPAILQVLQESPDLFCDTIIAEHHRNLLPRRETLFVALAVAACSNIQNESKHKLYKTLLAVLQNDEEFFLFIKYYSKQKKNFSSSLNRAISKFYSSKDPLALAKQVSEAKGYHGWTYKDLIKLSHYKSENILTSIVVAYILFGLKKAEEMSANNADAENIIQYLKKVESLKRSEKVENVAKLVQELRASYQQVPTYFHKSKNVWENLVPLLPINDIIHILPLLYKYGFFRGKCLVQTKVVQALTNPENIKSSKVHPEEVFIALKNFESGGKPMDPKLAKYLADKAQPSDKAAEEPETKKPKVEPPKCSAITSALNKSLQLSYGNLQPTGKRFMITIDMSSKMNRPCLKSKNITCIEAAVTMTLTLLKMEQQVCVAVFNDNKIYTVGLDRSISFQQALTKLRQAPSGFVLLSAAFEWAIKKKKQIDVFINFLYYPHQFVLVPKEAREKEKPIEALNKYRNKMNLPNTKMITFSLSSHQLGLADGSPNVLDVCGFDKEVPKVVQAFSNNYFC